jgi:hypothetical protein
MLADARDLFGDHGRTHPRNRYCPTESLYPPQARCSSRPGNSRVSNKLSSKFDSQTLPRHAATSNLASTQQKQNMFKRRRYTHLPRQGHKSFVVYTLTPKFLEVRILPGVSRQLSESKDSGEGKGTPGEPLTRMKLAHERRLHRPSKSFLIDLHSQVCLPFRL